MSSPVALADDGRSRLVCGAVFRRWLTKKKAQLFDDHRARVVGAHFGVRRTPGRPDASGAGSIRGYRPFQPSRGRVRGSCC